MEKTGRRVCVCVCVEVHVCLISVLKKKTDNNNNVKRPSKQASPSNDGAARSD